MNGLVPAVLTADSVFVLRRSIVLGDLSDCAIDGEYAGTGPVPTPADTMPALGELLQTISTRVGAGVPELPEGMHKWQGGTWDLLRSSVLRCLSPVAEQRPTAGELADLLSRYLAMHQVRDVGGTGPTRPAAEEGGDEERPRLVLPEARPRHELIRLGRFQGRGGPRRAEDRELLESLRAPVPHSVRLTLTGGRLYDGRAAFTAALGSLLAVVRGEPVLALDGSPEGGVLEQCLVEGRNPASWKEFAGLPDGASYREVRGRTTTLPSGLDMVAHHHARTFRVNPSHAQEYMRVLALTAPHYSFVLTDWTGELDKSSVVVLNHTDRLLVFCHLGARADAQNTLTWLRRTGREALAERALLVVMEPMGGGVGATDRASAAESARISPEQVVAVPYEPQAPYRFWDLAKLPTPTVRGLLAVAKALVSDF
ncbi:hypothetical protein ABZ714_23355 [Streptomyces sp. NPDC006798]|uniref:hypothetical protein n=1 Tax=Streptomyces sp. NPDC006798 TaxID=3155462 RepID=UPI0033C5BA49